MKPHQSEAASDDVEDETGDLFHNVRHYCCVLRNAIVSYVMAMTESKLSGAMGRPPLMKNPVVFTMKADADLWRQVDEWAARQTPPIRDRGAAVRKLLERSLHQET